LSVSSTEGTETFTILPYRLQLPISLCTQCSPHYCFCSNIKLHSAGFTDQRFVYCQHWCWVSGTEWVNVIRVSGIAEILRTMAHVGNVEVLESFVFVEWPKIFSKQLYNTSQMCIIFHQARRLLL